MKITAELLRENGACGEQVALFAATFPAGGTTCARNLRKAAKAGLAIEWLAQLIPADRRAEYYKACAPAWAEYYKACAAAWAKHDKACAAARAEYDKACAAARAEVDKACAPALCKALR